MKEVQIATKRVGLNTGQKSLYLLIMEKLRREDTLTIDEAVDIWIEDVCRYKSAGVPYYHSYRYENGKIVYFTKTMSDTEIRIRSIQWLMSAIGALVLKGHLKVIPTIQLERVE